MGNTIFNHTQLQPYHIDDIQGAADKFSEIQNLPSESVVNNAVSSCYIKDCSTDDPLAQKSLVNYLIAQATDGLAEGDYVKPADGIPITDLTSDLQTKINSALTTEIDPTVPAWAKEQTKPDYTYQEVQALPDTTLYAGSTTQGGSAILADKLSNSFTVNGTSFDGSANATVTITPATIGAASSSQGATADGTYNQLAANNTVSKANSAYQLPTTGMPVTNLDQTTQEKIANAIDSSYVDGKVSNLVSTDAMNAAIQAAEIGLFSSKGHVQTSTDLPTMADNFWVYYVIDNQELVYSYNTTNGLEWKPFSPVIDLSTYATTSDLSASLTAANNYTDNQLSGKLDVTAKAVDSSLLNGKSDTAFATSNQGVKADSAYQKPSQGIPTSDLASNVVSALNNANTALQTESDPTVPSWAKEPTKPSYTYDEVGALANTINYASSSSQGGKATAVENSLTILNGSTVLGTFDGSTTQNVDLSGIGGTVKTVNLVQGTTQGTVAIVVDGTQGPNIQVPGLNSAAFTDSSTYATAAQGVLASSAIQVETDPTVPSWAKQPDKPTYTPAEIGALPSGTTYAGSSTVAGKANAVANALIIQGNGNQLAQYDGSLSTTLNLTPTAIGAATSAQGSASDALIQQLSDNNTIANANSAYQKPTTGIPSTDLDPTILSGIYSLIKSNQSGQVKVRFDGLTASGFTANTPVSLVMRNATATIQSAPTTMWPQQAIDDNTTTYETGFFIQGDTSDDDRMRENNVLGQEHRWRVGGNYTGKDVSNQGRLRCFITNPDTGFRVSSAVILPSGLTDDDFTFEFTSISDNDSLATGHGYTVGFETSFTDENLTLSVNSIVRFSEAIDNLKQ